MAGTMVHLLVAEKLLRWLQAKKIQYSFEPELEIQADYFIAGNICPDGIMARENYQREMKLHTHFRDGIPDGSFEQPGMVPLFEKRLKEFWKIHEQDERECPGLYLGYITHMMTDERFILDERPKFFKNISVMGLTDRDRETFIHFNKETDLVDFKLLQEYQELWQAYELLKGVKPYEIKQMISEKELTASRQWILSYFFETEHSREEAEFLNYDSMVRFVETVTQEIKERLVKEAIVTETTGKE